MHRIYFPLLVLLIVVSSWSVAAAGKYTPRIPHERLFTKYVYRDRAGKALPYRLLLPDHYDKTRHYPMIIFLHGLSQRGDDNVKQLDDIAPVVGNWWFRRKYPCFVLVPQCPDNQRWISAQHSADTYVSDPQPMPAVSLTLGAIERVCRTYPVDRKRIYATGISIGGSGVWDMLQRRPELFAAAVPICAQVDPAIAPRIKGIPVWIFHGAQDTYIDVQEVRGMIRGLRRAGGQPRYTEYADDDHMIWERVYAEERLFPWLFKQSRK